MAISSNPQPALVQDRGGDAHQVSSTLQRKILNGEFSHEEKLPPERQLAVEFGCSRGTVRAAMTRLEQLKLIERRIGSGTFVSYRKKAEPDIANIVSPLELIDVRLGIEPQMARLAVLNASALDLERLQSSLTDLEAPATRGDPELFTAADEHFHLTMAEISGNSLMLWLYRQINDVRSHSQWSAMKDIILKPERIDHYNREHRELFDAISSRDTGAAMRKTTSHLERARNDLLGAGL